MSNTLNQPLHSPGEIIRDSPLDVLREGNLELAWSIADLFEIERCMMWYLLLAWELKDKGRLTEGRATLERLQEKELPRLRRSWLGMLEPHLLAYVFDLSEEAFTALHQKLFNSQHIALCRYLAIEEHFTTALKMAELIDHRESRSIVLWDIAVAQAQAGDIASALATVHLIEEQSQQGHALRGIAVAQAQARDTTAIETVRLIEDERQQKGAIEAIAQAQIQVRDITSALATAHLIDDLHKKVWVLCNIAAVQVNAGDTTAALSTLSNAVETAQLISDQCYRVQALREIAKAQAQADNIEAAQSTLSNALEIVHLIKSQWEQGQVLQEIAHIQAQTGDIATALETSGLIEDKWNQAGALGLIASAQTKAGDKIAARSTFTTALEMARRISDKDEDARNLLLLEIAAAMAQVGDIASAMETVLLFDYYWLLPGTLVEIAIEVAKTGEFVKAVRIAGLIYPVGNPAWEWRLGEWMIALQAIAQAQVKAGNSYAARSTLSNALQMAQPLDNAAVRAWTLVEILSIPSFNPYQMLD